jgi:hypothetical protein
MNLNPKPSTVEDFVEEILALKPSITPKLLYDYIFLNIDTVNKYVEYIFNELNIKLAPYTVVRHCLYLASRQNFQDLLLKNQLSNFDDWIEYGTINKAEISEIKSIKNIKKTHNLPDETGIKIPLN